MPSLMWVAGGGIAVGVAVIAVLSSGDSQEGSTPPLIGGQGIERKIEEGVESRIGRGISDVSCLDGADAGEQVSCDVRLDNGGEQRILIDVSGRPGDIRLDISVP